MLLTTRGMNENEILSRNKSLAAHGAFFSDKEVSFDLLSENVILSGFLESAALT